MSGVIGSTRLCPISTHGLRAALLCSFTWLAACNSAPSPAATGSDGDSPDLADDSKQAAPQNVKPPFAVRGELEGLLMVWFDAEGSHTAAKRSEIPEAQRAQVRIDALDIAPDARRDPERIYVADLRAAGADGSYPVQTASRSWFDGQVDRAKPRPAADEASVVIYKASWCGVCRSAASYLRSRHVAFVEKDVEKEPGANEEMLRKAHAKGLTPRGVPVIDFRGEIMLGFDQAHVQALIERFAKAI
jgi:glutaredoxin